MSSSSALFAAYSTEDSSSVVPVEAVESNFDGKGENVEDTTIENEEAKTDSTPRPLVSLDQWNGPVPVIRRDAERRLRAELSTFYKRKRGLDRALLRARTDLKYLHKTLGIPSKRSFSGDEGDHEPDQDGDADAKEKEVDRKRRKEGHESDSDDEQNDAGKVVQSSRRSKPVREVDRLLGGQRKKLFGSLLFGQLKKSQEERSHQSNAMQKREAVQKLVEEKQQKASVESQTRRFNDLTEKEKRCSLELSELVEKQASLQNAYQAWRSASRDIQYSMFPCSQPEGLPPIFFRPVVTCESIDHHVQQRVSRAIDQLRQSVQTLVDLGYETETFDSLSLALQSLRQRIPGREVFRGNRRDFNNTIGRSNDEQHPPPPQERSSESHSREMMNENVESSQTTTTTKRLRVDEDDDGASLSPSSESDMSDSDSD